MANKFGRFYKLLVEKNDGGTLELGLPFTIEFDINRNTQTSTNVASIRVYNLSRTNQAQIRHDETNYDNFKAVQLYAGYNDNPPLIFVGTIFHGWSVREGTNIITQMECHDGGIALTNGTVSKTYPRGTFIRDIILDLISTLSTDGLSLGIVGDFPGFLDKANTYSGNTINILRDITGGALFIDNAKVYALKDNENIKGTLQVITSDTGLLGTPVRQQSYINFDMLFEPNLIAGQKVELKSTRNVDNINGTYKINSIHHQGVISEAVCGNAITSVGLVSGQIDLQTVSGV